MKYYFIAGEASGDLHAGNCMRELKLLENDAEFAFTGGDVMEDVSMKKASIHIREMNFMGFVDVVKNISAIRKNFSKVKKDILAFNPDLLVLVDYPGFNLRMAEWAHKNGIKTDYYISPTVWAWKENRVEKIRKYVNRLYVILPFEENFYAKHNIKVQYVGHPLLDAIQQKISGLKSKSDFLKENALDQRPIIAVLPGSRKQEIERMMREMLQVKDQFGEYQFVVAASSTLSPAYYSTLPQSGVKVVYNQTYELMSYAQAGLIKSGTSTLESALLNLPQVVCYKGGALSYQIAKSLVNVKYISLPNLIMDQPIVKELIQGEMTAENISKELKKLLNDTSYRSEMMQAYARLKVSLGGGGASAKLAQFLYKDARS